jgi:hypothetical protein
MKINFNNEIRICVVGSHQIRIDWRREGMGLNSWDCGCVSFLVKIIHSAIARNSR